MSRSFNEDATNDAYEYSCSLALNDAVSMLIVCRILASDGVWLSLIEGKNGAGNVAAALGRHGTSPNRIYFANTAGTAQTGAPTILSSENWLIVATTRSTAAATDAHKLPIGGSRTTGTTSDSPADGLTMSGGTLRIGGNEDWAHMRVAAAAVWDGVTLTTGQLDGILSAKTTQSIADLTPDWLVDDSDAFATNLVNPGTMDRSSTVGAPADDADDPSGWVYGLDTGGPSQRFMWMP